MPLVGVDGYGHFERFLLGPGDASRSDWRGASTDEIAALELYCGAMPDFYRWFASRMGREMGSLRHRRLNFATDVVLAAARPYESSGLVLIALDSSDEGARDLYYDLSTNDGADAAVVTMGRDGGVARHREDSLRELLASTTFVRRRILGRPFWCQCIYESRREDARLDLQEVLTGRGLTAPVETGDNLIIFDSDELSVFSRKDVRIPTRRSRGLRVGGRTEEEVRALLGHIALHGEGELEVTQVRTDPMSSGAGATHP